jgi:hypothetical protein
MLQMQQGQLLKVPNTNLRARGAATKIEIEAWSDVRLESAFGGGAEVGFRSGQVR